MSHWLTRRLWRALGRRYTRVVLYAYFQVAHLITLAGVGLFALYADLDGGQLGRIIAVAHPDNAASRRVMEKCGMVYEGIVDAYGKASVRYAIAGEV